MIKTNIIPSYHCSKIYIAETSMFIPRRSYEHIHGFKLGNDHNVQVKPNLETKHGFKSIS